jgi:hypothetical protein
VYEFTFGEYVDIVLGDYRPLTISEEATDTEKVNARTLIMAEFADMTGDYTHIANMSSQYKLMRLNLKLLSLNLSERILSVMYDSNTFDYLIQIRVIPKNTSYPSTSKELEVIIDQIKSAISLTQFDINEEEAITKSNVDTKAQEPLTKKPFIKLLASISQFLKFGITFETNCAVVAEYVNRMRTYQETLDSKK